MNIKYAICLLIFSSFIFGCESDNSATSKNPAVISVEDSDTEMNEAIARARGTFDYFIKHWQEGDTQYSIKFGIPTSDSNVEHIWFNPIEIHDSDILAECANEPSNIPDLSLGDRRTLNFSQLSDWMIIKDGKCYGGYTIRVLAARDPSIALPYQFSDLN